MSWNPNFLAYAQAHGREPQAMIDADAIKYPGGKMCGYILWIMRQEKAFRTAHPEAFCGFNISDLKAWGWWLQAAGRKGEVVA